MRIAEKMFRYMHMKVKLIDMNGNEYVGIMHGYESAYDNEGDGDEPSVLLDADDGSYIGFFESNIKEIELTE